MKLFRFSFALLGFFLPAIFAFAASPANEPIPTGDSTVVRNDVNFFMHVPPTLSEPHGPSGVLILFTGSNDNPGKYSRSFAAMADALDLIVITPAMPWSNPKGTVQVPVVFRTIEQLQAEIARQFQTTPDLVIVGGASAGGGSAADFAKKESKTSFLILASTGPLQAPSRPRTLHIVGDKEASRLGGRPQLGKGRKDLYAIPGGQHAAQFPHDIAWLETEVSGWRLEQPQVALTMRAAEDKLAKNDPAAAQAILKSTLEAINILKTPASGGSDEFFTYETKRRQELLTKNAPVIQSLERLNAKLAPKPTPAPTPEAAPSADQPDAASTPEAAATDTSAPQEAAASPSPESAAATPQDTATATP